MLGAIALFTTLTISIAQAAEKETTPELATVLAKFDRMESYMWLKTQEQPDGWAAEYSYEGLPVWSQDYKTYRPAVFQKVAGHQSRKTDLPLRRAQWPAHRRAWQRAAGSDGVWSQPFTCAGSSVQRAQGDLSRDF